MGAATTGVLLRGEQRREVAELAQRVELHLLVGGEKAHELPRLGLVLRVPGDRVERAAVRRVQAAWQRRRAPLAGGRRREPVLQVAGQPRAHHLAGDAVGAEARDPFVGPHRGARVDAGLVRAAAELERAHEARRVHQHLAVVVEVDALAGRQVRAEDDVDDVGAAGEQARAGGGLELDAGGDEGLPVARQVGLGEAGLGDEVGAVQQRAGTDVGRQRAQLALGVGGLRQRVGSKRGAQCLRAVGRLVQVLEAAGADELADELEVDGHHVGQAGAGGERGGHRVVVVGVLQRHDLHVDVRDASRDHAAAAALAARSRSGKVASVIVVFCAWLEGAASPSVAAAMASAKVLNMKAVSENRLVKSALASLSPPRCYRTWKCRFIVIINESAFPYITHRLPRGETGLRMMQ